MVTCVYNASTCGLHVLVTVGCLCEVQTVIRLSFLLVLQKPYISVLMLVYTDKFYDHDHLNWRTLVWSGDIIHCSRKGLLNG